MSERNGRGDQFTIQVSNRKIPVEVEQRARKTLEINVHPDQRVTVVAPLGATLEEIIRRTQKRGVWILKQIHVFEELQPLPPEPRYVSGETHRYLGRQYRLKIAEADRDSVKLKGRFLYVHLGNREDTAKVERLLEQWYRSHARDIFQTRLKTCLESARSLKLEEPPMTIRKMVKRWGSCTSAGRILLNLDLVKVPLHCIEYVIMHELCHLKVHNHSRKFYQLLSRCMPDWEQRKARLDLIVL